MRRLLPVLLTAISVSAQISPDSVPLWKDWHPAGIDRFYDFFDAIYRGDIPAVRQSLDSGISLNWQTETGLSPVLLAAASGNDSLTLLLLDQGARVEPQLLVYLAIQKNSLSVLKWAEKHGKLMDTWHWGSTKYRKSPVVFAFSHCSMEIIEFLISSIKHPNLLTGCFGELSSSMTPLSPKEKALLAHRLLDAGVIPDKDKSDFMANNKAIYRISEESGDALLKKRVTPLLIDKKARQLELNQALAWRAGSLKSVDSLLALGADPLGSTGGSCTSGGKDETSPLVIRRGSGCNNDRNYSAFDWQAIERFRLHDPAGVERELFDRDRLFIAVTTGDLATTKRLTRSKKDIKLALEYKTRDNKHALAFAADAGDAAITQYLLTLPFDRKEKELALHRAVNGGAVDVVQCLLSSEVDPQMPAHGGNGIANLMRCMLYRYGGGKPADTLIARFLLTYSNKMLENGRYWKPGHSSFLKKYYDSGSDSSTKNRISLPMSGYAIEGPQNNPDLFSFLWKYQPGPLNGDTLFSNIRWNPDILLDTAIVRTASTVGYEDTILSGICASFNDVRQRGALKDDPKRLADILSLLNRLLDRGIALNAGLEPGWVQTLGIFQIGLDKKTKRFIPVWCVSSLFSDNGVFNTRNNPGDWFWYPW